MNRALWSPPTRGLPAAVGRSLQILLACSLVLSTLGPALLYARTYQSPAGVETILAPERGYTSQSRRRR